jgi:hypothetical protein
VRAALLVALTGILLDLVEALGLLVVSAVAEKVAVPFGSMGELAGLRVG